MSELQIYRECLIRDYLVEYVYDHGFGGPIEVSGRARDCDLFWPEHEDADSDGWLRHVDEMRFRFEFSYETPDGHERNLALLQRFRDQEEHCVAGCDLVRQGAAIASLRTREAVTVKMDPTDLDRVG